MSTSGFVTNRLIPGAKNIFSQDVLYQKLILFK